MHYLFHLNHFSIDLILFCLCLARIWCFCVDKKTQHFLLLFCNTMTITIQFRSLYTRINWNSEVRSCVSAHRYAIRSMNLCQPIVCVLLLMCAYCVHSYPVDVMRLMHSLPTHSESSLFKKWTNKSKLPIQTSLRNQRQRR